MKNFAYLLILFMPLFSCSRNENTGDMNDRKQQTYNEDRMREFYKKVINEHNPAMIDSFCTSDFKEHQPFPGQTADREGLKKGFSDMMTAFPDLTFDVDFVKSWGDTVIAKIRVKGTNSGMFMGMPATNKTIDVEGADIITIKDGKATQHWGYLEENKMMGQLGMGQPEAQAPSDHNEKEDKE
jgi:steroid delta-isomerase-like uncharacterized protein